MWLLARLCLSSLVVFFALGCRDPLRPAETAALRAGFEALARTRRPEPLTAEQLNTTAGLDAVLARGLDRTGPVWAEGLTAGSAGAVQLSVIAQAETTEADGESLGHRTDRMAILLDARGRFALNHGVDWSLRGDGAGRSGRRCWGADGRWWVADAEGPITEVPVLADEQWRCLRAPAEMLAAPLRAWLDQSEVVSVRALAADAAVPGPLGRSGFEVVLRARRSESAASLASTPAVPSRFDETPASDDRAHLSPLAVHSRLLSLDARVRLDAASGAPVDAALSVVAAFRKDRREGRLNLKVRLRSGLAEGEVSTPIGAPVAANRARIYEDLKMILGSDAGLVPSETDAGLLVDLPAPGSAPPLVLDEVGEGTAPPPAQFEPEVEVAPAPPMPLADSTPSLAQARFDEAPEATDSTAETSPNEDPP